MIKYIELDAQIIAAVITALCGTIGILLNIWINIFFRNKDYNNQNRIRHIQFIETYHRPFSSAVGDLKDMLDKVPNSDLHTFMRDDRGEKFEVIKSRLKKGLDEIDVCINNKECNYIGSFKLYQLHSQVLYDVRYLRDLSTLSEHMNTNARNKEEIIHDISKYREEVERHFIRLISRNYITYCYNFYVTNHHH